MPSNWIIHTPSTAPSILTNEDIIDIASTQISQFFLLVQAEFLHGATKSGGHLPLELQERASACEAAELAVVICEAIVSGSFMDSGWTKDYWDICERIAGVMGGYPKECLKQWRAVRESVEGLAGTTQGAVAQDSCTSRSSDTDPALNKRMRFLELPEDIRARIYEYLVPTGTLVVSDWNFNFVPEKTMLRRTEYDVPDDQGSTRRTTYIVHTSRSSLANAHLALMATNRIIAREMADMLYSNCTFEFQGTASATLAFLHDHMRVIGRLRRVLLRYTTSSKTQKFLGCVRRELSESFTPPPTLKTNLPIWKKILNKLMFSASGLEDLILVVDKGFWERAEWEKGVEAVLGDTSLCENKRTGKKPLVKNFLADVCNLSGVNFRLVVEGTSSTLKSEFVKELEKSMCERMNRRPYLAETKSKCWCRKRLLSEACAWNGDEKRTRV